MKEFKSLSEIINSDEKLKKFKNGIDGYQIVDEFNTIFPELSKVAAAKKYFEGVLFLHAENSVWRSELNFKKELMINKINRYLGKEIIKKIKFI